MEPWESPRYHSHSVVTDIKINYHLTLGLTITPFTESNSTIIPHVSDSRSHVVERPNTALHWRIHHFTSLTDFHICSDVGLSHGRYLGFKQSIEEGGGLDYNIRLLIILYCGKIMRCMQCCIQYSLILLMVLFPLHLISLHLIIIHNFKRENSFSASLTTTDGIIWQKLNSQLSLISFLSS